MCLHRSWGTGSPVYVLARTLNPNLLARQAGKNHVTDRSAENALFEQHHRAIEVIGLVME